MSMINILCVGSQGSYMTVHAQSCQSLDYWEAGLLGSLVPTVPWVKVFRIIPEFRILRLTFHRKSASKS